MYNVYVIGVFYLYQTTLTRHSIVKLLCGITRLDEYIVNLYIKLLAKADPH